MVCCLHYREVGYLLPVFLISTKGYLNKILFFLSLSKDSVTVNLCIGLQPHN